MSGDWLKAIGLAVLASIIGAASKLAIRKSFHGEGGVSQQTMTNKKSTLYYWMRVGGMFGMMIVNPLCGVCALLYASPSLVVPFSGLDLVWIVLGASHFVGEDPTKAQLIGVGAIVVGEIIVAITGDHSNHNGTEGGVLEADLRSTLHQLLISYQELSFIMYHVGFALWMILLCCWTRSSSPPALKRLAWGAAGGSVTGLQHFVKDFLTLLVLLPKLQKSLFHIPKRTLHYDSLSWNYFVALLTLGFLSILTAASGMLLLTACMQRYSVIYSSALFMGSMVLNSSLMSAIHYHTFSHVSSTSFKIFYPLGLLILLGGVVGICTTADSDEPENRSTKTLSTTSDISSQLTEQSPISKCDYVQDNSASDSIPKCNVYGSCDQTGSSTIASLSIP
jgi:uncharacterized membrane protein